VLTANVFSELTQEESVILRFVKDVYTVMATVIDVVIAVRDERSGSARHNIYNPIEFICIPIMLN